MCLTTHGDVVDATKPDMIRDVSAEEDFILFIKSNAIFFFFYVKVVH